jgi:hypothetical protein
MPVGLPTQRDIDIEALLAILHRNDLPGEHGIGVESVIVQRG